MGRETVIGAAEYRAGGGVQIGKADFYPYPNPPGFFPDENKVDNALKELQKLARKEGGPKKEVRVTLQDVVAALDKTKDGVTQHWVYLHQIAEALDAIFDMLFVGIKADRRAVGMMKAPDSPSGTIGKLKGLAEEICEDAVEQKALLERILARVNELAGILQ